MTYRINSSRTNMSDSDVVYMRLLALGGNSQTEIANQLGVHRKTVYNVLNNKTWNHVPEPQRAYGYKDYLILPDGQVYSRKSGTLITRRSRSDGSTTVRIRNSGGREVTVPVATLVARAYHGSRSSSPRITYRDGNPSNTHFTNISV